MAIYLDHASTTPLDPEIAQLIASSLQQAWANPASQHAAGRRARCLLEDAKDRIKAVLLGDSAARYQQWQAWQLVLTSGGTEANNLALNGLAPANSTIFVGATEHPSLVVPARHPADCASSSVDSNRRPDSDSQHRCAYTMVGRSPGGKINLHWSA